MKEKKMSLTTEQTIQSLPDIERETGVHVYVEISYSKSRKKEMITSGETDCTMLISLLKDHLGRQGIKNVKSWTPTNKDRFADVVLEYIAKDAKELEHAVQVLESVGGSSILKVKAFILE